MRGEETQILGALDDLPAAGALVCLPGTHSKWARVERGRITSFSTYMTGELYAVMKSHSILGRMMEEGAVDLDAFATAFSVPASVAGCCIICSVYAPAACSASSFPPLPPRTCRAS